MQLNQNYVMSEAAYTETGKKKDIEQIERLDRALRQKERSIAALKINAIKQEERDKAEINNRTKENTYLVVELNYTKLEEKKLERENLELAQKAQQLGAELLTAKSEAANLLQAHGLSAGGKAARGADGMGSPQGSDGARGARRKPDGSGTNFFQRKKENLEDRARI